MCLRVESAQGVTPRLLLQAVCDGRRELNSLGCNRRGVASCSMETGASPSRRATDGWRGEGCGGKVHANLLFLEADRVDHNIVCEQRLHRRPRKPLRLNRNGKAATARSVGAWKPYSAAGTGLLAAGWVRPVRHDGGPP